MAHKGELRIRDELTGIRRANALLRVDSLVAQPISYGRARLDGRNHDPCGGEFDG